MVFPATQSSDWSATLGVIMQRDSQRRFMISLERMTQRSGDKSGSLVGLAREAVGLSMN